MLVCEGDNSGEGKETVEPAGSAKGRPPGGAVCREDKISLVGGGGWV